jgi:hypothetical protein
MKIIAKYCLICIVAGVFYAPKQLSAQAMSFQVFNDNLSPYGYWVNYPNYGYAWIPNVGPDFIPYSSAGYWAFTSYGWTWVSNYSWGWAPFHYGRWWFDNFYGWLWVPDNVWGPAWVLWRSSPGFYGWAPLGPNISMNYAMGGGYAPPLDYWCFLPSQYMGRNDINYYYGPRKNTQQFINTSTVINNTYTDNTTQTTYIAGPRETDVEKAAGHPVKPIAIKEHPTPAQLVENNELKIYRPAISKEASENVKPAKIADKNDIPPVTERKTAGQENKITQPVKEPVKPLKEPVQKEKTVSETEKRQMEKSDQNKKYQHTEPVRKIEQQPKQENKEPERKVPEQQTQIRNKNNESQTKPAQKSQQPAIERKEYKQPDPIQQQQPGTEPEKIPPPQAPKESPPPREQNVIKPVAPPPVMAPPAPAPKMNNQPPPRPIPQQSRPMTPIRPHK